VSSARNKTLHDFSSVFRWIETHELEATVIGGLAVGAFAAQRGIASFSADLDLLVAPEEQQRFLRLARADPDVNVAKHVQPRSLQVLVLEWGDLEVDVLVKSAGLPSPEAVRARAWNIDGIRVADPVDLLGIKLEMRRTKDLPHIEILREVCEGFACTFFRTKDGREAFEFLTRWAKVEGWARLPPAVFDTLLSISLESTPAGRKYLVQHAPSRTHADAAVAAAPQSERAQLHSLVAVCHR
jgi:hypothetical protein